MPTSINSIPPELLHLIFSLLVHPPPSLGRLYNQPFHDITDSTELTLKSCSRVSKRWRQVMLPVLFGNARMLLQMDTVHTSWQTQISNLLTFVQRNDCESKVESFTLVVQDPQTARFHYDDLDLESLESLKDQWQPLFNVIDPLRLTIVAPPPVLAALAALHVNLEDVDEFYMPYHILSLERPASPACTQPVGHPMSFKRTLLSLCPWQSLLLNEGSFVRPYSTSNYHAHIDNAPSVLRSLVSQELLWNLFSTKTINSVSYIAIFPAADHTAHLYALLRYIQRLYVQFMPQHDLYPDPLQRGSADVMEMAAESGWATKRLVEAVFSKSAAFPDLREVECGDVVDDPSYSWKSVVNTALAIPLYQAQRWTLDPQRDHVMVRTAIR